MGEPTQSSLSANKFVIFLDENHCRNRAVIEAIEQAGIECQKLLDHFAAGTEDLSWLPEVGRHGWCLLTTDARIRSNTLEKEAVRIHSIRMFYFSRNNLGGAEMGAALRKAIPAMRRLALEQAAPFYASISRNGEVSLRSSFHL